MLPLVSILIPAYNAEKWLGETVESALNQIWPRKEIIIIDDGSSDNTGSIARRIESKLVKVVRQENKGGPAARNRALSYAQGDFIQWLDHDDLLDPGKISHQLKNGEDEGKTRVLFSSAFGTFFFRKEKAKFTANSLWRNLEPIEYFLLKFNGNLWLHPSVWLVSRRLTEMAGPWLEEKSPDDDGEYFCRVVASSERIQFERKAISYWRIGNSSSMSRQRTDEALRAFFMSIRRSIAHLMMLEDSPRTREACLNYLGNLVLYFYPEKNEIMKEANDLARELGGIISPQESRRFFYMRKVLGWKRAKKIQNITWNVEVSTRKAWDRLLYGIQRGSEN